MPTRRIAFVNQREGGGATAVCHALERGVRALGHATLLAPSESTANSEDLIKALTTFHPDVIHLHCFYNAYPAGIAAALADIAPIVFTVHDTYPVNSFTEACWPCDHNAWCYACPDVPVWKRPVSLYRIRERRRREAAWQALARANTRHGGSRVTMMWPSEWMRERCSKTALASLPGVVSNYGIDLERFRPRLGAKALIGVGAGPLVVTVANMYAAGDRRKGLHVLLEAWENIVGQAVPDASLRVLGRVHGLTAPTGVTFTGEVDPDQVPLHFAAADLSVLPTLGDNCPLAVLESLASGCPVVASRVGGIPEVVVEGETGWLVQPDDPEALAAAILDALKNASDRRRRALKARHEAEGRFDGDAYLREHLELYGAS